MNWASLAIGGLSFAWLVICLVVVGNDPRIEATDLQVTALLAALGMGIAGLALGGVAYRRETGRDLALVGIILSVMTIGAFLIMMALGMAMA